MEHACLLGLLCSQQQPTGFIYSQLNTLQIPNPSSLRYVLIISSNVRLIHLRFSIKLLLELSSQNQNSIIYLFICLPPTDIRSPVTRGLHGAIKIHALRKNIYISQYNAHKITLKCSFHLLTNIKQTTKDIYLLQK
jgi:hypothetical protein